MSPDTNPEIDETETPDADVMQRVATALEATDTGGTGPTIVRAEGEAAPLPPRRGG